MKIMAFVGSPRKNSNTDILTDRVIEGAQSKTDVTVQKIYLYDADIKSCSGCLVCTPVHGSKDCPLKDGMPEILNRMVDADAFIFATPNHVHSMSPAMVNLFSRMQPLVKMKVLKNSEGKIIGGESQSLVAGKKATAVVSQGDFSPSASALILRALDSNIKDFKMKKIGEVLSTGNLAKAAVRNKTHDLELAFALGQRLAEA